MILPGESFLPNVTDLEENYLEKGIKRTRGLLNYLAGSPANNHSPNKTTRQLMH